MATIAQVATWRARDGKVQDFLGKVATAKKIHERLGAKVRVFQTVIGGQPLSAVYVIEHASWAEYGKFGEKLEKDTEWQSFWQEALARPTADLLQNGLLAEAPGF